MRAGHQPRGARSLVDGGTEDPGSGRPLTRDHPISPSRHRLMSITDVPLEGTRCQNPPPNTDRTDNDRQLTRSREQHGRLAMALVSDAK